MGMCRRVTLRPASAKGRAGNNYGKAFDPASLGKKRRRADGEVLPLFYPLASLVLLPKALPGSHAARNQVREAELHPERQQGSLRGSAPPIVTANPACISTSWLENESRALCLPAPLPKITGGFPPLTPNTRPPSAACPRGAGSSQHSPVRPAQSPRCLVGMNSGALLKITGG